jgi:GT2 family glycosyltransferase
MNKHISIILTAHKSKDLIINYIKNIYQVFHIIVIDNSNDIELEKEIKKNYPNVTFNFMPNDGYGAAINLGSKFVKTEYFLVSNPDVEGLKVDNIMKFYDVAKKLNNQFSIMGPVDLDHKPKRRKVGYDKIEITETNQISGICMFFNKKNFDLVGGI